MINTISILLLPLLLLIIHISQFQFNNYEKYCEICYVKYMVLFINLGVIAFLKTKLAYSFL